MDILIQFFQKKYALGDWIDLKAGKTMHIRRGEYINIPLGVAMKLPKRI